jgi:hypothetical protein
MRELLHKVELGDFLRRADRKVWKHRTRTMCRYADFAYKGYGARRRPGWWVTRLEWAPEIAERLMRATSAEALSVT